MMIEYRTTTKSSRFIHGNHAINHAHLPEKGRTRCYVNSPKTRVRFRPMDVVQSQGHEVLSASFDLPRLSHVNFNVHVK